MPPYASQTFLYLENDQKGRPANQNLSVCTAVRFELIKFQAVTCV